MHQSGTDLVFALAKRPIPTHLIILGGPLRATLLLLWRHVGRELTDALAVNLLCWGESETRVEDIG